MSEGQGDRLFRELRNQHIHTYRLLLLFFFYILLLFYFFFLYIMVTHWGSAIYSQHMHFQAVTKTRSLRKFERSETVVGYELNFSSKSRTSAGSVFIPLLKRSRFRAVHLPHPFHPDHPRFGHYFLFLIKVIRKSCESRFRHLHPHRFFPLMRHRLRKHEHLLSGTVAEVEAGG